MEGRPSPRRPAPPSSTPPPLPQRPRPAPCTRKGHRAEPELTGSWGHSAAGHSCVRSARAEGQCPPAQDDGLEPWDRQLMTWGRGEGPGGQREASWASGGPQHAGIGGPLPAAHSRRRSPLDATGSQAGLGTGPWDGCVSPGGLWVPCELPGPFYVCRAWLPVSRLLGEEGRWTSCPAPGAGYWPLSLALASSLPRHQLRPLPHGADSSPRPRTEATNLVSQRHGHVHPMGHPQ